MKELTVTRKLTVSALVVALYVVVMTTTRSFAFGQYQVRVATSLYALSGVFPFLVLPLGFANFLSNALMGGLGPLDMVGGILVGLLTSGAVAAFRRSPRAPWIAAAAITLIPGLGVPLWLSYLLHLPYSVLAASLLIGQAVAGVFGGLLLAALKKRLGLTERTKEPRR
ncbi:QueT transporter family protein [Pyramidobacter sp. YE332]|uniref:QueT transporter family protein n=1 Tax=unclassified Pyramidobacter TaxID=2632171 RepID=UPI00098FADB9|nr:MULTISPECIES: QueT transporter family protein [unclassified Pyramidobacter]OON89881.1 hypothetical protein B0D78_01965 [Pyramidobacter sp. C12-8]WOL40291.1 QueT transporter family protein [Pyramidobacter sp. YE332]